MVSLAIDVSLSTLEETPNRVVSFFAGVTHPDIWVLLASVGYTQREHNHGRKLLLDALEASPPPTPKQPSSKQVDATTFVEDFVRGPMRRYQAALMHRYADQAMFAFGGLDLSSPPDSSIVVTMFLHRLDAMDNSPERKAFRKEDHAALALLRTRGLTPQLTKKVVAALSVIEKGPAMDAESAAISQAEAEAISASLTEKLGALRAWYAEWAVAAKTVVKRRDQLISLGLASRRKRVAVAGTGPSAPAAGTGSASGNAPNGAAAPSAPSVAPIRAA